MSLQSLDRRTVLSSLALAGLAGCLSGGSSDVDPAEMQVLSSAVDREDPAVEDGDLEALVRANDTFALEVLDELASEGEENRFLSPFSISLALAMTWAGARGETEAAMAETLAFSRDGVAGFDQDSLHPAFNALWRDVEEDADDEHEDTPFTLNVANSIWGQDGFPFEDAFLETLARHYGAGLRTIDFEGDPDGAREAVNDWVAEETEQKIDELFPEDSIDENVRLVLTNAVYFLANWYSQFDEADTEDRSFTALDGSESTVPTMHQHLRTKYAEVDGHEVIELPYVGDATMVVLLPAEGEFESFRGDLDADRLADLFDATGDASGDLAFPRFEFESSTSLEETLSSLGMGEAFSDGADFSGMTDEYEYPLAIADVYHDAYVSVDEDGTEAAAATGVGMSITSAPSDSFDVVVDRPFLFAIRDDATGSLLFLGQVVDAAAAQ